MKTSERIYNYNNVADITEAFNAAKKKREERRKTDILAEKNNSTTEINN